jgi:hypothetical protein
VHALVLLSEDERSLKVSAGADALFDNFRARGRNLIELNANISRSAAAATTKTDPERG